MTFAAPQYLWLLLALPPAMTLFFWWSWRARQKLMAQFIQARLLPGLIAGVSVRRQTLRAGCLVLAAACLVLALARPQWGYRLQQVRQRGLDIVVAIDTSKSMLAQDIAPDRLTRAKLAALDLMRLTKSDRMGLVAFAGDAFLQCPLTLDDSAFEDSVNALDVNTIPLGGTAIAQAIQTAQEAFKKTDNYKVLVLLTDGEDHEGGVVAAARDAAKAGMRIFTVGIGTAQGALLRITDANGQPDYIRDAHGNVVKSHLDAPLLRQIAGAAKGFYLPLRGADTMEVLYQKGIAPLPKSESQERWLRFAVQRYQWPLAAAIVLLVVEMFLPERKPAPRRTTPASAPKPRAAGAALLLLFLLVPAAAHASPSSALRDYNAGNFTNALQEFSRLAQAQTNNFRLIFNAGDAAYRLTNFDDAAEDFTAATLSPDLDLQEKAYYNLGNTRFQLARTATDLDGLQKGLEAAERSFRAAVVLNTNDADASFNLEFTSNMVAQLKAFRVALARAQGEADAAVRRAEFHRALEIMLPLEKTLLTPKQVREFTQRLKNIDAIATPHHP